MNPSKWDPLPNYFGRAVSQQMLKGRILAAVPHDAAGLHGALLRSCTLDVHWRFFDRQVRSRRGMTALGNAALRQIALKVLAQHTGSDGGSEALAAAVDRAYADLARMSVPLIGEAGVDALTGRALHLVRPEYPWLVNRREPGQADGPFAQVISGLKRQDPAVAAEAAGAVFATFAGLLVTFIGEPLTAGLLRKAWPDAFPDAITEETT